MSRAPIGLLIAIVLVAAPGGASPSPPARASVDPMAAFDHHIDHIVFLMQENHAFDSLYGVYCPTTGTYCSSAVNGVPNVCIPEYPAQPSKGCVRPYNFTLAQLTPHDMPHDWASTHKAIDNGAMDNFYVAEGKGTQPFGHYNGTTVPFYWDLAEEYGLADDLFATDASYSLPNHWDEVAAVPPAASQHVYIGNPATNVSTDLLYLNQSDHTPSIESTLLNSSVSWKFYDYPLKPVQTNASSYNLWNPLAARAQSYLPAVSPHFTGQKAFFTDAAKGRLPNLSWIIPTPAESDHPPANLTTGQDWVASVVDALESSKEWNSTVLFVSWDEYGGFYDHVRPPVVNGLGDGIRVPLLAVGPWVREGYVDPTNLSFSSILRLMEDRFNLSCLGPVDCGAQLPLGMFNFSLSGPRAPIDFATNGSWSYPMPLESTRQAAVPGPGFPFPVRDVAADGPVPGTVDGS